MSDSSRRSSSVAMEQLMHNHKADSQYVQLGFTPPPSPSDLSAWAASPTAPVAKSPYLSHYAALGASADPHPNTLYSQMNQQLPPYVPQPPYSFVQHQQPQLYHRPGPDLYDNHVDPTPTNHFIASAPQDFNHTYKLFEPPSAPHPPIHEGTAHLDTATSRQLIENVVGNWVPNTNGTYSPFGDNRPHPNLGNLFEKPDCDRSTIIFEDMKPKPLENKENRNETFPNFNFSSRDSKKPSAVVQPMRPTYSDVLAKSVPLPTVKKPDPKEAKQRKENGKKPAKNEKTQKSTSARLSNGNETKCDKTAQNNRLNEKINRECAQANKLNRKWASLDNLGDSDEGKKGKRGDENGAAKGFSKVTQVKVRKHSDDFEENDSGSSRNDTFNITKTSNRKGTKLAAKQRNSDGFGSADKPPGRKGQRYRKRESHVPFGVIRQKIKQYIPGWWKLIVSVCLWLVHLISDICSLSIHISRDMIHNFWNWLVVKWSTVLETTTDIVGNIKLLIWIRDKFWKKENKEESSRSFLHAGLQHNISMPTTGEEAMKRLLACKGKDPYSILGVTPTCTDDDIKRYYKRQAFLVHPDKNPQPGAEEAFKILVHAFDMIGEPERRASYDRGVAESAQVEQAWSELTELLAQLQKKVEAAANTIRCSACGLRHKRVKVDRPSYAARNCATCKIHHAAREGDIWAEARCMGFLWHYYACMEGGVYDITEWAGCQKDSLKHLRPGSHHVQYRIALGKQAGSARRHQGTAGGSSPRNGAERPPDLENLLNSLYGQQQDTTPNNTSQRRRNKKSNK